MKSIILKINKGFYYGWVIVVLSAITFFLSAPGQTYSISVFIKVYVLIAAAIKVFKSKFKSSSTQSKNLRIKSSPSHLSQ